MPRLTHEQLKLYLVTDQPSCLGRNLFEVVEAAVAGGVRCVQLREKTLSTRKFVQLALAMKERLDPHGVPLIINDRLDVALACGAQGLHLGQNDLPVELARRLLPAECWLGLSVETLEQAELAAELDVDYFGVSPVFATPTKTDTGEPWGLEGLSRLRKLTTKPLIAIGGIQPDNAQSVMNAGADGIAVVSAICSAPSPGQAAQTLLARIT